MVEEKTFECMRTCDQYIQNVGEHYNAIVNNCVDLCVRNFGVVAEVADWKKSLEIGLVVLIILLVMLGLIIGFSKLRNDDEEEENELSEKTYY